MCGESFEIEINSMTIGDRVRVVKVPPDLPEGELHTRSLFDRCLGLSFPIAGIEGDLLELHVGEVLGKLPCMDVIWIESEYVELVSNSQ